MAYSSFVAAASLLLQIGRLSRHPVKIPNVLAAKTSYKDRKPVSQNTGHLISSVNTASGLF